MNSVRIEIVRKTWEKVLEILPFLLVAGTALLISVYYQKLPEQIHLQFNWLAADANGLASKNHIWAVPIISALIVAGIYKLTKYPWLLNYSVQINEQNAVYYYQQAIRILRFLSLALGVGCFALISLSIAESLGISNVIFDYAIPLLCTLLIGISVFYILK